MNQIFLKIVNMSISAGWLVLAVLVLRLALKKAPRWTHVLLWGLVALRLLFPISVESALSLLPSGETIPQTIEMDRTPAIHSGLPVIDDTVNPVLGQSNLPAPGASINPMQVTVGILSTVWLAGMAALTLYTALSYWRLRRQVFAAVRLRDNIYQSENAASPFVLGLVRPRIYLPFSLNDADLAHVIAHEQTHIRRGDHWWKPLGFALLTLHWFNPLMWLAYILLCRDIELACDEKVIRDLDAGLRADYTQALLTCSVSRRSIVACPLAFGEVGIKTRVRSVLYYRKPAFLLVVLAVAVCAVTAVCFLTDPVKAAEAPDPSVRNPAVAEYIPGAPGILGTVDTAKYTAISPDFAIGADRYGRAVFVDPHRAFDTMAAMYAEGIRLIGDSHQLAPISPENYKDYKVLGGMMTAGTPQEQAQAVEVARFLDIYENSFDTQPPPQASVPTAPAATEAPALPTVPGGTTPSVQQPDAPALPATEAPVPPAVTPTEAAVQVPDTPPTALPVWLTGYRTAAVERSPDPGKAMPREDFSRLVPAGDQGDAVMSLLRTEQWEQTEIPDHSDGLIYSDWYDTPWLILLDQAGNRIMLAEEGGSCLVMCAGRVSGVMQEHHYTAPKQVLEDLWTLTGAMRPPEPVQTGLSTRLSALTADHLGALSADGHGIAPGSAPIAAALKGAAHSSVTAPQNFPWYYVLHAYPSDGDSGRGMDAPRYDLAASYIEDVVYVRYQAGRDTVEEGYFRHKALYDLIRGSFPARRDRDEAAYARYGSLLQEQAQKTVDRMRAEPFSQLTGQYEITGLVLTHSFLQEDSSYAVYAWDAAYQPKDLSQFGFLYSSWLNAEGTVQDLEEFPWLAVRTDSTGTETYRFLDQALFLEGAEEQRISIAENRILEAFAY